MINRGGDQLTNRDGDRFSCMVMNFVAGSDGPTMLTKPLFSISAYSCVFYKICMDFHRFSIDFHRFHVFWTEHSPDHVVWTQHSPEYAVWTQHSPEYAVWTQHSSEYAVWTQHSPEYAVWTQH